MAKSETKYSTTKRTNKGLKYKTRNNIYKTPYGSYCVQKMINGEKLSMTFRLRRDAVRYVNLLNGKNS